MGAAGALPLLLPFYKIMYWAVEIEPITSTVCCAIPTHIPYLLPPSSGYKLQIDELHLVRLPAAADGPGLLLQLLRPDRRWFCWLVWAARGWWQP
jgi:hypothetical protein